MSRKQMIEALSEKADQTNDRERAIKRMRQLKEQFQKLTDTLKKKVQAEQQQQQAEGRA